LARQSAAVIFTHRTPLIRHLTLPAMPDNELADALRWEAKKYVAGTIDDIMVDYLVVGRESGAEGATVDVVLVAAEKAALMSDIQPLQSAGLKVTAIDVNPLSWLAAVEFSAHDLLEGNVALVDLGAGKVEITMARNGALRMTRRVNGGGHEITNAIARELNLSVAAAELLKRQVGLENPRQSLDQERADRFAEVIKQEVNRLILEIQRSIEFYRVEYRERTIQRLLLGGGTALLPGLRGYMESYFEAPIDMDDPFKTLDRGMAGFEMVREQAPRFSTAVGLARWEG
jgi:type IV pilus assembly protein PilM